MITPSFDFATRLADLAIDLDNEKELLNVEHRAEAFAVVLSMQELALKLHPSIFDDEPEEPVEAFSPHTMVLDTCKKCGGVMKSGQAIQQTAIGMPDFHGDKDCITLSPGGKGKLVDCNKCEQCGWSVTA